jgi:hypothetical protein
VPKLSAPPDSQSGLSSGEGGSDVPFLVGAAVVREAGVVRLRFALTDGQPRTLDHIGWQLLGGLRRVRWRVVFRRCHDRRRA